MDYNEISKQTDHHLAGQVFGLEIALAVLTSYLLRAEARTFWNALPSLIRGNLPAGASPDFVRGIESVFESGGDMATVESERTR